MGHVAERAAYSVLELWHIPQISVSAGKVYVARYVATRFCAH